EGEHVVDLVGEVAAAGGHDGGMPGGDGRIDLRERVGQGEDDGILGHGGHVRFGKQVRGGDSDEHVRALDHIVQRAFELVPVGGLGDPLQTRVQVRTVASTHALYRG